MAIVTSLASEHAVMQTRRLLAAIAAAALAVAGLMPTVALAANAPDVTGTIVTGGGTPMAGVTISVLVEGNDMVWSTQSDANGAWGIAVGVQAGQTLHISAQRIDHATPDPRGCVATSGFAGRIDVTVDALPLAPVVIKVSPGPSAVICSATASPRTGPTPPATDAAPPGQAGSASVLLVLVGLGAVILLALGPVRRPFGRR